MAQPRATSPDDMGGGDRPLRVVVGDDSLLVRGGAVRALERAGFDVVAEAVDADELLRKVRAHRPDVALVDVRMPPEGEDDGLRAAEAIRSELPDVGVLLLSQYADEHWVGRLLAKGSDGAGYLLKERLEDTERLIDAVRRVATGGSALDPEVVAHLLGRRGNGPLDALTPREREVLGLMAEGLTNRAIAGTIFLSERAVERHVTAIFGKLGLDAGDGGHRRVLAVLTYLRG